MKPVIRSVLLASACFVAACESANKAISEAWNPSINVAVWAPSAATIASASQTKTPGHFAVMIQSGAWRTTEVKKDKGINCFTVKYPTDFDTGYAQAAREGFEQAFESVVFVTTALKPEEMKSQKLDAQIIVSQASITANFSTDEHFASATIITETAMDGAVAVIGLDGLANQRTIKASGSGSVEAYRFVCDEVPSAINLAGGAAIEEFVHNSVNGARLGLLEMKGKKASAEPVN